MTRRAVLPPTDTERGAVREGQRVWIEALAGGGHDARLVRYSTRASGDGPPA